MIPYLCELLAASQRNRPKCEKMKDASSSRLALYIIVRGSRHAQLSSGKHRTCWSSDLDLHYDVFTLLRSYFRLHRSSAYRLNVRARPSGPAGSIYKQYLSPALVQCCPGKGRQGEYEPLGYGEAGRCSCGVWAVSMRVSGQWGESPSEPCVWSHLLHWLVLCVDVVFNIHNSFLTGYC